MGEHALDRVGQEMRLPVAGDDDRDNGRIVSVGSSHTDTYFASIRVAWTSCHTSRLGAPIAGGARLISPPCVRDGVRRFARSRRSLRRMAREHPVREAPVIPVGPAGTQPDLLFQRGRKPAAHPCDPCTQPVQSGMRAELLLEQRCDAERLRGQLAVVVLRDQIETVLPEPSQRLERIHR